MIANENLLAEPKQVWVVASPVRVLDYHVKSENLCGKGPEQYGHWFILRPSPDTRRQSSASEVQTGTGFGDHCEFGFPWPIMKPGGISTMNGFGTGKSKSSASIG